MTSGAGGVDSGPGVRMGCGAVRNAHLHPLSSPLSASALSPHWPNRAPCARARERRRACGRVRPCYPCATVFGWMFGDEGGIRWRGGGGVREVQATLDGQHEEGGVTGGCLTRSGREAVPYGADSGGTLCVRNWARVDGGARGPRAEPPLPGSPCADRSDSLRAGLRVRAKRVDSFRAGSSAGRAPGDPLRSGSRGRGVCHGGLRRGRGACGDSDGRAEADSEARCGAFDLDF